MLDAVYVDTKEAGAIVTIKPKPPFRPVFQVATTKERSAVEIINGPPEVVSEGPLCFWWRRGRVELPVQKNPIGSIYRLIRQFILARPLSAERLRPGQPIFLRRPLPASGPPHLDFSSPSTRPSRRGQAGRDCLSLGCQCVFAFVVSLCCHLIYEGDGTSACSSGIKPPCRTTRPQAYKS